MKPAAFALAISIAAALLGLGAGRLAGEEPGAEAKGIAALSWLEGCWRSADGPTVWEACYTSAEGGEIASATKQIKNGKVTLFDFERIREEDGKILLTPFPFGKASVDFTLTNFDPAVKRAVFVNDAHDFPQRMRYEITPEGWLKIMLMAEKNGEYKGFKLELLPKK